MGYIGNEPTTGHFPVQTNLVGPGPTYTLTNIPASAGAIEVSVSGVLQPTTAYSVVGTTLTMAGVGTGVPIFIRYLGETLSIPTPGDGTITDVKIADVAATKLTGTIDNARISLDAAEIPSLDANKITTGTFDNARISAASVTQHASDYIGWQSVVTAATLTAVAGRGYPINTTSNACTVTLPASASVGDTIKFTDYLRTWGTNAVTINTNSLKFQGYTTPQPIYNTNGQSVTITYMDVTQGWIPTVDDAVMHTTAQALSATGGTESTYTYDSVDYKIHTFKSTGANNFVISSGQGTIDFLVIAGGGGGSPGIYATTNGGGGGAGGLRWFTAITPSIGTYVATVGAGGAGGNAAWGTKGINSSLIGTGINVSATGGGRGGYNTAAGGAGGCGGGSSGMTAIGGSGNEGNYTPVEGYSGNLSAGHNNGGSGGGGTAQVGGLATSTHGGAGGNGINNFLDESSVAFTTAHTKAFLDAADNNNGLGEVSGGTRYIGGGGTGGNSSNATVGGLGGGGDNNAAGVATAGDINTGSGGGGSGHNQANNTVGNGGSGVIIIRYLA